ncbi:DNA primase [subsurface metagenome]
MKKTFRLWDTEEKRVIEVEATKVGKEWRARCPRPNHEDENPSLFINEEKEVYNCHGCPFAGHLYNPTSRPKKKSKKPKRRARPTAIYDYKDEKGKLLFQVIRYRNKGFSQRQPNGQGDWIDNTVGIRRVLYRLPELVKAQGLVFIVEGEKDTDNLLKLDLPATTNPMGAGKWKSEYNQSLKHFEKVVLLPDNDQQGRLHMRAVGNSLLEDDFKDIRLLDLPGLAEGEDISDWLKKDSNNKELLLLHGEEAPTFSPFEFSLEEVLNTFKRWLVLDESTYIEVVLATVISNLIPGDPVWLFLTGQSGGSKTEVLRTLFDSPLIYPVSKFTAHTLISGKRGKGQKDPSLLPLLNNKTLIIKDFSCILEMPRDDRGQIFADLRDAYDGEASKKLGLEQQLYKYKSHFSMIAGTTGAIDAFTSVRQALGERFLKIRLAKSSDDLAKTLKALDNVDEQERMRKELGKIVSNFLSQPFKPSQVDISQGLKKQLALLANFVGKCRTSVSRDPYMQGVIKFPPEPELGTRLGVQFAKLAKSLAVIKGKVEVDKTELDIIRRVALDTIPKKVLLLVKVLYENVDLPKTAEIGNKTKIGPKTALLALHDLEALELVESEKATSEQGSPWCWSLAENFRETLDELNIWQAPEKKELDPTDDLQKRMKD